MRSNEIAAMKNERGYYTIYHRSSPFREERAKTARAAINKAQKLCAKYLGTVDILIDRGQGKTTSKVFHYGQVKEDGGSIWFTREGTSQAMIWDDQTKRFWNQKTPRRQTKWFVDRQHIGTSDEELTAKLKALFDKEPQNDQFSPDIIAESVAYALLIHKRNQRLFRAIDAGTL